MSNARFAACVAAALLAAALLTASTLTPPAPLPSPPIPLPGASSWADAIDNTYLPLEPGRVWVYSTLENGKSGTDSVEVLHETKSILGATAVVVRDRSYIGKALDEDSYDWYAQDAAGNVWYLGEDTREYRGGRIVSTAGSWEAGKYGAQPGIVMWARPSPGGPYRQEFRRGSAEDLARVVAANATVSAEGVTYQSCVQTEEWSPLEPGVKVQKFYARGVGLVRTRSVAGPHEEMTLLGVSRR
jgi:hypothetical protein